MNGCPFADNRSITNTAIAFFTPVRRVLRLFTDDGSGEYLAIGSYLRPTREKGEWANPRPRPNPNRPIDDDVRTDLCRRIHLGPSVHNGG
jgi:hypothetical protein